MDEKPAEPVVTARCAVCRETIGISEIAAHRRCESPAEPVVTEEMLEAGRKARATYIGSEPDRQLSHIFRAMDAARPK